MSTRTQFFALSCRVLSLRPAISTSAPCLMQACAVAKPIPRMPPVITILRPLSISLGAIVPISIWTGCCPAERMNLAAFFKIFFMFMRPPSPNKSVPFISILADCGLDDFFCFTLHVGDEVPRSTQVVEVINRFRIRAHLTENFKENGLIGFSSHEFRKRFII